VAVRVLQPETMCDTVTLPGNVEAWREISLAAEAAGRIASIAVKEGDRVKAGVVRPAIGSLVKLGRKAMTTDDYRRVFNEAVQLVFKDRNPLVRLDHDEQLQQASQAAAAAALRHVIFRRAMKLRKKHAASEAEVDQAEAEAAGAQAHFRCLLKILSRCDIASPIEGIVDELPFDAGEHVKAGDVVARIVQVDRLKVVVDVPERDVPYIRVDDTVPVRFDFLGQKPLQGRVIFVRTVADKRSRTFPTEIEIANPDGRIRPGMIARVTFTKQRFERAMVVPLFAVIPFQTGYSVFVAEKDRARRRPIEVGILDGLRVQVTRGLEPGDRLVVKGQRQLQDGKLIEVRETTP
jgi:membrane fusion protein, multidrug efflux system